MTNERDVEIYGLRGTMSQKEIALKYGLTQARVSQIMKKFRVEKAPPMDINAQIAAAAGLA